MGDYQDLPFRLSDLFIILVDAHAARHESAEVESMCLASFAYSAMLCVCACMLQRNRMCHRRSGWEQVGGMAAGD